MSTRAMQTVWTPLRRAAQANTRAAVQRQQKYTTEQDTKKQQEADNVIPTWNDYFALRKKRRTFEIASYVPSTVVPAFAAMAYFAEMEIDPFTTIMGMDPVMAAAIGTVGAGFGGFLCGPVVGDLVFKALNSKKVAAMDVRDKIFYEHVKKNRADARLNSIRNPVPDYYGEKILSVSDYRAWLRKQREHYRKGVFGGSASNIDNE